ERPGEISYARTGSFENENLPSASVSTAPTCPSLPVTIRLLSFSNGNCVDSRGTGHRSTGTPANGRPVAASTTRPEIAPVSGGSKASPSSTNIRGCHTRRADDIDLDITRRMIAPLRASAPPRPPRPRHPVHSRTPASVITVVTRVFVNPVFDAGV